MDPIPGIRTSRIAVLGVALATAGLDGVIQAQDDPPPVTDPSGADPVDPGTVETMDARRRARKDLERIQFLSNIDALEGSPSLFPLRSWTTSLELDVPRPSPFGGGEVDPLFGSPLEPVLRPWRALQAASVEQLGLDASARYTLLYQHVTNPVSGKPGNLGTGRLDFDLVWNLWDRDRGSDDRLPGGDFEGHGLVGVLVRQGNQIGVPQSSSTQGSVGSIEGLDSLYSGRDGGPATLNLLYYQQGWCEDRLVVSAGKIHPNQYIGLNFWANDESRQFLAGPFDGIQPLGSSQGGYQLGVAVQAIPTDSMFVNAVVADALGRPETMFSTLGDGYVWSSVETGFVLPFDERRLGGPTVATLIWSGQNLDALAGTPSRHWSNAFAVQWQGHLSPRLGYWVEGGWSQPRMSTTQAQISCGIGIERPFGRRGDLFGVGFAWSRPSSGTDPAVGSNGLLGDPSPSSRFVGLAFDETDVFTNATSPARAQSMIEAFYRIQLTESMQLSPDLQIVFNPGARDDADVSVILGLRLTTDF